MADLTEERDTHDRRWRAVAPRAPSPQTSSASPAAPGRLYQQVMLDHGVASPFETHLWPHSWVGDTSAGEVTRKIRNLIGN